MRTIIIPKPIPQGQKVDVGQQYSYPACDRCLREGSSRNPVILSNTPRKSHSQRELARGIPRRDALCVECREYLKRGY